MPLLTILPSIAVSLNTNPAPDRALDNLAEEVRHRRMIGVVSASSIELSLSGMSVPRDYQPTFKGKIEAVPGGSLVTGTISNSKALRGFMYLFLGFGVLCTGAALFVTQDDPELRWTPLAGLAFLGVSVAIFNLLGLFTSRLAEALHPELANALAKVA